MLFSNSSEHESPCGVVAEQIRFFVSINGFIPTLSSVAPRLRWRTSNHIAVTRVAFVGFLLLAIVGLSPPALQASGGGGLADMREASGVLLKQILNLVCVAVFGFCALRLRARDRNTIPPASLVLALAWIWISLSWADAFDVGIRRTVHTSLVIASGFLVCQILGPRVTLETIARVLAGVILVDIAAVAVLPAATQATQAFDLSSSPNGTWRGLHVDKNSAGVVGAVCVLYAIFMILTRRSRAWKIWWAASAVLATILVVQSGSKTSLGLLPVSILFGLVVRWLARSGFRIALSLLVLAAIACLCAIFVAEHVSESIRAASAVLADPRGFTGRSYIWQAVWRYAVDNLWLGSGYGSFWSTGLRGVSAPYLPGWLRLVPNAHNGYLDLLIQTGVVGLLLGVWAGIIAPLAKLVRLPAMPADVRWLLSSLFCFAALHNMLETSLFDRDRPLWIALVVGIAVISTYRQVRSSDDSAPR